MSDRTVKATRAVQVALLLLAALAGLSMAEQTATTRTVGQESLAVGVEAPVQDPRGPWSAGDVFTEDDAGIPVDVAPRWNVTASHTGSGVDATDHVWSATLVLRERGPEGGNWWRVTEDLPVEGSGASVRVPLDANATLQRARQLEAEAGVPGTLQMRVVVRHQADLVVQGEERSTVTVASLTAIPDGDRVTVTADDDGTTFAESAESGLSPLPFALAGAAAALEIVPWRARKDRRPWEDPDVETVQVEGLSVPADVPRTTLERLVAVAKRRDGVVLVDVAAGIALLRGPPDLWARLGEGPFEDVPGEDGPADPSTRSEIDDLVRR